MNDIYLSESLSSGEILAYSEHAKYYRFSEIEDAISSSTIKPKYRFTILTPDETINFVIPNGDIVLGGNYNENYQNGQRRSINLDLYNYHKKYTPSINNLWVGTKIGFEMGIEMPDGVNIFFPKGIYVISNMSLNEENKTVSLDLEDKFSVLEGKAGTIEKTYEIPPNTPIKNIIKDTLLHHKGNGEFLDPQSFIYHSSFEGKKTYHTIRKEAGETFGSIILDLAKMLSAEVFYNSRGMLTFAPIAEVANETNKPVLSDLGDIVGDIVDMSLTFDMNEIINRVVVIGATINEEIFEAIAENHEASSPTSIDRIGYRTAPVINDENITSKTLAEERARYELRKKSILQASVPLTIIYNPLLSVNNIITVTQDYFNLFKESFLIQSISMNLDYSGTMNLSTCNVNNIPFLYN